MALVSKPVELGRLKGTLYTFERAGDKLPMHAHDETTVHVTFIQRGPVHCTNAPGPVRPEEGEWERVGNTGDFWDFDPGQHEFTALADGAQILNIIK